MGQTRQCTIYRSDRKPETYLYLAAEREWEDLPPELRKHFGRAEEVMTLEIRSDRPLARVEVASVIEALDKKGYYLQLPPRLPVEEEISRWFNHS